MFFGRTFAFSTLVFAKVPSLAQANERICSKPWSNM